MLNLYYGAVLREVKMIEDSGHPVFTMSMYVSSEELHKAKGKYYQEQCAKLEVRVAGLEDEVDHLKGLAWEASTRGE
jgi:hypothetical protein